MQSPAHSVRCMSRRRTLKASYANLRRWKLGRATPKVLQSLNCSKLAFRPRPSRDNCDGSEKDLSETVAEQPIVVLWNAMPPSHESLLPRFGGEGARRADEGARGLSTNRPERSCLGWLCPIRLITVILRTLVQSYMQPRNSHSGGAEPNGTIADTLQHGVCSGLPQRMPLRFRCPTHK